MTGSPPVAAANALRDASSCADNTVAMLRSFGRSELAVQVERYAGRSTRVEPTVVVAGETKRGKSSLVNSLLGRRGLSPVDIEVATCVHVSFYYADTDIARVSLAGQQDPVVIDLADIGQYANEQLNPCNSKGVMAITVGLPVPLLRHLTLIDTPGVGGLELGHAALTLQALESADALLFVIDPEAPVSKTELTFLERAAERIDTVIVVLTKIDAYPEWRTIWNADGERLQADIPHVTRVYPVSSVLADRAQTRGAGRDAAELRRNSGLPAIERALTEYVADRAHLLAATNTIRFCLRAVDAMTRLATDQLAAAKGDPELDGALAAEETRLAALAPAEATWRAALADSIARRKVHRTHEFTTRLSALQTEYDGLVTKRRSAVEFQHLAGQFTAAVDAMRIQLANETAHQLGTDVLGAIEVLAEDTGLQERLSQITLDSNGSGRRYDPTAAQQRITGTELYMAVMPVMGIDRLVTMLPGMAPHVATHGAAAAAAASGGAAAGTAALPVLALAAVAAVGLHYARKKIAARNQCIKWMHDYAAAVRTDDTAAFNTQMIDVVRSLTDALNAGIQRRSAEVRTARATLSSRKADTAAQRKTAADAAQRRLNGVNTLKASISTILRSLYSAPAAEPPAAEPPAVASP